MGLELAKAWVRVRGDASQMRGDLDRSRSGVMTSVRSLATGIAGALATFGFAVGVQQGIAAIHERIELAKRQIMAEARLAAVIRATGGAAGFTAAELQGMASNLQQITTYGDEAILEMQAILATFRQIRGDNFERATRAALDLTAVMGGDLKSAALQLGKALEDPTIGLTALRRSGVSFTEQQQEQIKALVEQNQLFEAQVIILTEVEAQLGGVAEALAQTDPGRLEQINNELGDMKEQIGTRLLPIVVEFKEEWLEALKLIRDVTGAISGVEGPGAIGSQERTGPPRTINPTQPRTGQRFVVLPDGTVVPEHMVDETQRLMESERGGGVGMSAEDRRQVDRDRRAEGLNRLQEAAARLNYANEQARREEVRNRIRGAFGDLRTEQRRGMALERGMKALEESPLIGQGRYGFDTFGDTLQDALFKRDDDLKEQTRLLEENNRLQEAIRAAIENMQTGLS